MALTKAPEELLDKSLTSALTITTADNTTQLTITSTDDDASVGPRMDLKRESSTPAANDNIGALRFMGKDDDTNSLSYANITSQIEDPTDGAEDGKFKIETRIAGTIRNRLTMDSTKTVFNEDSQDLDFRVESNSLQYALFVDGGNDVVGIGTSVPASYHANANNLVIYEAGNAGITIATGSSNYGSVFFGDGTSGSEPYTGWIQYGHDGVTSGYQDVMTIGTGATQRIGVGAYGISFGSGTHTSARGLDDYEEGTWTPSVESTGSATFSNSRYTKVGRIVTMHTSVNSFSNTTSSTLLGISLPFTAANSNLAVPLGTLSVQVANITPTGGYLGGTNLLNLYGTSTSTSFVPVTHADLGGSTSMYISITYMAA